MALVMSNSAISAKSLDTKLPETLIFWRPEFPPILPPPYRGVEVASPEQEIDCTFFTTGNTRGISGLQGIMGFPLVDNYMRPPIAYNIHHMRTRVKSVWLAPSRRTEARTKERSLET
jgi:hypothetical protein